LLSASYETLIEALYTSDKPKLEAALESDAKEVLNDAKMRDLLKNYILRIDKDSNFEPQSMKAVRYFELLETIRTLEEYNQALESLKCFCTKESDLCKVVDESSLRRFIQVQKRKIFRKIDESHEYSEFKADLKFKYQKRRRRHR
jgi:hypothetical protein